MMDAVEFNKAKGKMCSRYADCDDGCPLYKGRIGKALYCEKFCYEYPEEAVKIVEDYWKNNRPKTNAEWVAEKLKEIGYGANIAILKKRCPVGYSNAYGTAKDRCSDFAECDYCRKWWDEIHEEQK